MEPNYSTYSENELKDSLANIDKSRFPERAEKIQDELAKRQMENPLSVSEAYEVIDSPSKFYACPSCDKKIGMFSKTINKWGKVKNCPHCHEPFVVRTSFKSFFIYIIPIFFLNFFLLRPILKSFEINTAIGTGFSGGLLVLLTLRLKKIRKTKAV